jgi:SAM-dependent methyltransferase
MDDVFAKFKAAQKTNWVSFAPLQAITTRAASHLVRHARVKAGQRVLDVGCGTGVVAITAARAGARVTGLDLTPELLTVARENSAIAGLDIDWHEGDVEKLPFDASTFDVVVSQFGHMFAPRPELAIAEMLRVLKPGGTIAFSTWPPELLIGRIFALSAKYLPPAPDGVSPPPLWGDPGIVRQRFGDAVRDVFFDRARMESPALSLAHFRGLFEQNSGPVRKFIETNANEPEKIAAFRREFEAIAADYFDDNAIRQDFLMTRAIKQ